MNCLHRRTAAARHPQLARAGGALATTVVLTASMAMASLSAQAADDPSPPPPPAPAPAATAGPDLTAARRLIAAQDWAGALAELQRLRARHADSADVHNLSGFALRKSGRLEAAFEAYRTALRLDPRHRGAHEYIGEAYLLAHQPDKAREHLAQLKALCGEQCEQTRDLAQAIAAYRPK